MNCNIQIKVSSLFPHDTLVTREVASLLFSYIEDVACNYIEADFSDIFYISRSFADQFHKEKIKFWESRQKEIVVVNANDDVFKMFQAVSKTQNSSRASQHIPIIQLTGRKTLKDFLQSL